MFKVNNKNPRTTPMTYFTSCSSVSIVNFEQVYADRVGPQQPPVKTYVNLIQIIILPAYILAVASQRILLQKIIQVRCKFNENIILDSKNSLILIFRQRFENLFQHKCINRKKQGLQHFKSLFSSSALHKSNLLSFNSSNNNNNKEN